EAAVRPDPRARGRPAGDHGRLHRPHRGGGGHAHHGRLALRRWRPGHAVRRGSARAATGELSIPAARPACVRKGTDRRLRRWNRAGPGPSQIGIGTVPVMARLDFQWEWRDGENSPNRTAAGDLGRDPRDGRRHRGGEARGDPRDRRHARRDRRGDGLGGRRERRHGSGAGAAARRTGRRGVRDPGERAAPARGRRVSTGGVSGTKMTAVDPWGANLGRSLLLTDLYQLNMLQAYRDAGMAGIAVFEFFVRKLPPTRGFLVAAGLEQVIEFLETARVSEAELDWLARSGRFSDALLDDLANWRFTGDVHAMPEGTVFFPDEPILRVTAPLPQAQLVESRIINLLQLQTLIASKAARMVLAAPGKTLVDFGLRRAHGAEAGLLAARACYLAGFAGSATALAE